jgi:hypothetical protein
MAVVFVLSLLPRDLALSRTSKNDDVRSEGIVLSLKNWIGTELAPTAKSHAIIITNNLTQKRGRRHRRSCNSDWQTTLFWLYPARRPPTNLILFILSLTL